jgi:hypothetical protein
MQIELLAAEGASFQNYKAIFILLSLKLMQQTKTIKKLQFPNCALSVLGELTALFMAVGAQVMLCLSATLLFKGAPLDPDQRAQRRLRWVQRGTFAAAVLPDGRAVHIHGLFLSTPFPCQKTRDRTMRE